jgi:hypothetical protein
MTVISCAKKIIAMLVYLEGLFIGVFKEADPGHKRAYHPGHSVNI